MKIKLNVYDEWKGFKSVIEDIFPGPARNDEWSKKNLVMHLVHDDAADQSEQRTKRRCLTREMDQYVLSTLKHCKGFKMELKWKRKRGFKHKRLTGCLVWEVSFISVRRFPVGESCLFNDSSVIVLIDRLCSSPGPASMFASVPFPPMDYSGQPSGRLWMWC